MAQYGTSYYVANRFFPETIKQQVFLLYAFVRIPDDIVDEPGVNPVKARNDLDELWSYFLWIYEWVEVPVTSNVAWNDIARDAAALFHRRDIPLERVRAFFDAMYADLDKKIYYTYEELQQYMHGSAEVVGLMMCKIIGYEKEQEAEVFRTAKLLGEAMQYTNFLRDIAEDSRDFDRLYMPEDRLLQHGLNHMLLTQYLWGKAIDDQRIRFMSQQVLTTKELYREASQGIALLDSGWRKAVRVASWMYESILDKIIKNEYDVFSKDAHTTKLEKMLTLFVKSIAHAIWKIT